MLCPTCQTANAPGARVCAACGQTLYGGPSTQRKGLAISSMVLGLLSLPLMCVFVGLVTAPISLVLGVIALVKANKSPAEFGGKGMAITGIVASALAAVMIPIVAAIAIPSLLRARIAANEAAAVGDMRTVISAQATYASMSGGQYGSLACLENPQSCLSNVPPGMPPLLDSQLAGLSVKNGYERSLHLGGAGAMDVSSSNADHFAYVAVPVTAGRTGMRAFCGDEEGVIRVSADGTMPMIIDGRCPDSLSPLSR